VGGDRSHLLRVANRLLSADTPKQIDACETEQDQGCDSLTANWATARRTPIPGAV